MKVSIIIPVFNEQEGILEVIQRVLALDIGEREIIVVDDGSTDRTPQILEQFRDYPFIKVHSAMLNFGKGTAIRVGLHFVSGDVVVIQDGDLEYYPEDISALLQPLREGKAQAVFGSRFLGHIEEMRWPYWLANKIVTMTANLLYGAGITDDATAYKAFATPVIKGLNLRCTRFEFCAEVTAKVRKKGYSIVEVPIRYRGRSVAQGKKVRLADAWRHWWTLVKNRVVD